MIKPITYIALLALSMSAGCSVEKDTSTTFEAAGFQASLQMPPTDTRTLNNISANLQMTLIQSIESLAPEGSDSYLGRFNLTGHTTRVPLPPHTFRLLDICRHYNKITDGAFDITTANLASMWEKGIPKVNDIADTLEQSGMQYVDTADNGTALLLKPDIHVTPGLATPAYALDISVVNARRRTDQPILVQLGPFARSAGNFPKLNSPGIAVHIPERLNNDIIGHITFTSPKAVANRSLPHREGKPEDSPSEYLIDIRTGFPALGTRQVIVMGPLTIKAHALSEALLILGKDRGEKILRNFPEYDVMLVPDQESVVIWMTPGFKRQFTAEEKYAGLIKEWAVDESMK